jgi:hypothetical protein
MECEINKNKNSKKQTVKVRIVFMCLGYGPVALYCEHGNGLHIPQ